MKKKILLLFVFLFNTNLSIAKNKNDFIEQQYFNENIENLLKTKYKMENHDLIFQNKLFKLKINEQVGFEKRYKILESIKENHAFGVTEVNESGYIQYSGLFGNIKTNNINDFIKKLKKGKNKTQKNLKIINDYKFNFSENAIKYQNDFKEKDLIKIAKNTIGEKGNLFLFEIIENGNKELLVMTINNKKEVSLTNVLNLL